METTGKLIALLREAESILETEGNYKCAGWIGNICDSVSLGDDTAIEELRNNMGGMGGFWEASNSKKFGGVIERIGELLDNSAF